MFLVIYSFTTCIGYSFVVIDQTRSIVPYAPYLLTLMLIPFSSINNLSTLKYGSYMVILAIMMLLGAIYYTSPPDDAYDEINDYSISGAFLTLPIFCFAYHGHMSSVKIYRRVKNKDQFPIISLVSFMFCFCIYNLVSCIVR